LKFQKLFERIVLFNKNVSTIEYFGHFKKIGFSEPESHEWISRIERELFKAPIPEELKTLYKELGYIMSYGYDLMAQENGSIFIQPFELLEDGERICFGNMPYYKIKSMGLIDYIAATSEFFNQSWLPPDEIAYLNENYKCFGYCRFERILDEIYFFYFDQNHQFGWVRYHQDQFDALLDEHLTEMLQKSQANEGLEEFLIEAIDELELAIFNDDF